VSLLNVKTVAIESQDNVIAMERTEKLWRCSSVLLYGNIFKEDVAIISLADANLRFRINQR